MAANPPPSMPPPLPLPPLPGPSPISEKDTLLFLSSSRASKLSLASDLSHSPSRPTSIATLASVRTTSSASSQGHLQPSARSGRDSVASTRSVRSISNPQLRPILHKNHPEHRPSIAFSISEEAEDFPISQNILPDLDDDDDAIERVLDLPQHPWPPISNSSQIKKHLHSRQRSNSHLPPFPPPSLPPSQPLPHPPPSLPPLPPIPPDHPRKHHRAGSRSHRPSSPDINQIISSTPRPRRATSKSRSSSHDPHDNDPSSSSRPPSREPDRSCSRSRPPKRSPIQKLNIVFPFDQVDPIDPDMEARLERQLEASDSGTDALESDSSLDLNTPLSQLMLRHGHLSPNSKLLAHNESNNGLRPISTVSVASTSPSLIASITKLKDERDTPKRRRRHRDGSLLKGGIGLTTGLGWSDSEDEDAPSALTKRLSTLDLTRRPSASFSVRSMPTDSRLAKSFNGLGHRDRDRDRDRDRGRTRDKDMTVDEFGLGIRSTVTPKSAGVGGKTKMDFRTQIHSAPPTSWTKRPSSTATNTANRMSTSSVGSARSSVASSLYGGTSSRTRALTTSSSMPPITMSQSTSRESSSTASSISIVTPSGLELDPHAVIDPDGKGGMLSPKIAGTDKMLPPLPLSTATTTKPKGRARAHSSASQSVTSVASGGRQASKSISSSAAPSLPTPGSSKLPTGASTAATKPAPTPRPLQLQPPTKALRLPSILRPSASAGAVGKQAAAPVTAPNGLSFSLSTPAPSNGGYSRHVNDQQRLRASSGPRYSDSALLAPSGGGGRISTLNATAPKTQGTTTTPTPVAGAVKAKPRTGTGMTYRNTTTYATGLGAPPQGRMTMMRLSPSSAGGNGSSLPGVSPSGAVGSTGASAGASGPASSFSSSAGMPRTKVALVA